MRWLVEPSIDVSPRRRRRSAWRPWAGLRSAVHARTPGGGSFAVSTNGGGSDGQAGTRKLRPSQSVAAISPGGGSDRELRVGGCDLDGHAVNVGYFGVPAESTSKVGRRGGRVGGAGGRWCSPVVWPSVFQAAACCWLCRLLPADRGRAGSTLALSSGRPFGPFPTWRGTGALSLGIGREGADRGGVVGRDSPPAPGGGAGLPAVRLRRHPSSRLRQKMRSARSSRRSPCGDSAS
jgi:hypothetical protein